MKVRALFISIVIIFVSIILFVSCGGKLNTPPNQPFNPHPEDGAVDVSITTDLTWECTDVNNDVLRYDVYFGKANEVSNRLGAEMEIPLVATDVAATVYNPGTLNYGTTYYWKVVAKDEKGGITEGPIWRFTTIQPPGIEWQKALGGSGGDDAYSIQQTNDGGYIVTGYTSSNDGDVSGYHGWGDFWVVKLDENGNTQWQRCLGGSGGDVAYSIQQTSDGGYIVAGKTSSNDGDVSGNHGYADFWVVKLDGNGNIEWQKCLGGSGNDWAWSIQQTSDGGYIVAGRTESNDGNVSGGGYHGEGDFWVVKLDENGNIQWQKCYGGSGLDQAHSIQQTSDGGYIVTGDTFSNDGDVSGWHGWHGCVNFWVVKLDGDGNIQWQKCLGGSSWDGAVSIQQTSDGGYIVAGMTASNDGDVSGGGYHGESDFWVVKLDEEGNIQWQRCLGGSGNDWAWSIQQTSDGGYIVAGMTASNDGDVGEKQNHGGGDFWVVKLK